MKSGATTGSIELDPNNPEGGKVELVVDVESVHSGDEKRDAHLKRADFFDSAQFPSIEFTSTKIAKGEKDGWFEVTGDLEMRGASKEITIPVVERRTPS